MTRGEYNPSSDDRIGRALNDLRLPFSGKQSRSRSLIQGMAELATPAASISVIDKSEVAWTRGFGVTTSGTDFAVTPNTLFQAGSISKVVFALAVMRLAQDGTIDLDANVNRYLRSWQIPVRSGWHPFITLRHLLSHTAGTTVGGFPGYPGSGPWPNLIEILQGAPPANTEPIEVSMLPGVQFQYSGGGTTIAQQVVVDRLGQPFSKLMRDLVFRPLGMMLSTYEQPLPESLARHAARGHPWNGIPVQGGWHVYPELAAAGLWTTPGDLAKLGADVIRAWRGEQSGLGLRQETIAAMFRPQLPVSGNGEEYGGLGWFCRGDGDDFCCGHRGWNHGFVAELMLFPARAAGAVVMLNSNRGASLREEILDALGREYFWPRNRQEPSAELDGLVPSFVKYAGRYRHPSGIEMIVAQLDDHLELQCGKQPPLPLFPQTETEFVATSLDIQVRFYPNAEGEVTRATLTHANTKVTLTRM